MIRRRAGFDGSAYIDDPELGRVFLVGEGDSPEAKRAKKHPGYLEYILVHEMARLRERKRGDRFTALMDDCLPNWRTLRHELCEAPLAEEEWS